MYQVVAFKPLCSACGEDAPLRPDARGARVAVARLSVLYRGQRGRGRMPVEHPALFGIGPASSARPSMIGECKNLREIQGAVAFLARFPSILAARR